MGSISIGRCFSKEAEGSDAMLRFNRRQMQWIWRIYQLRDAEAFLFCNLQMECLTNLRQGKSLSLIVISWKTILNIFTEQKSKAALRLRMCPLVQRSANNPGFPSKGLAQHFARVPVVEVCEADLRFWKAKLGTLNHSSSKVLKNLKHFEHR